MNFREIRKILGLVLLVEGLALLLPCVVALIYAEKQGWWFLATAAVCLLAAAVLHGIRMPQKRPLFAKEGFVAVGLSWVVMSVFGALPFVLCGDIPNYVDALFETVSGFTTTGASILLDVEALCHTSLFWRSFTHWLGGMGVFVLLLAVLPLGAGYNMHLMRAESPGPSVGKLVPRLRDTAKILYLIYIALTVAQTVLLLIARMPLFDALCSALGTAGTGGFGIKADSFAGYSAPIQVITTVFMILFGVNFNAYFFLMDKKQRKNPLQIEEVRVYFSIILIAVVSITINIFPMTNGLGDALNKASFQVGSVITTTGFATADFNLWPTFSKTLLVCIMFCGACAGSTGGGIKVSRVMLMFKSAWNEVRRYVHPRGVYAVKMDGKAVDDETMHGVQIYLLTYVCIFVVSLILITVDNFSFTTNFTAVTATLNNIGPGLEMVGPTGSFHDFSWFSKFVFIFDMLAGRLELYPMLILLTPEVWRKK